MQVWFVFLFEISFVRVCFFSSTQRHRLSSDRSFGGSQFWIVIRQPLPSIDDHSEHVGDVSERFLPFMRLKSWFHFQFQAKNHRSSSYLALRQMDRRQIFHGATSTVLRGGYSIGGQIGRGYRGSSDSMQRVETGVGWIRIRDGDIQIGEWVLWDCLFLIVLILISVSVPQRYRDRFNQSSKIVYWIFEPGKYFLLLFSC